ncbi:VanZ family protein [Bradyrhizobium sp. I1.7.5]|uniref:VanZ family protein n=1 Tax=Bradyrhizobium sp. I1.7.5 TaxID=3156363 RepID=UPI003393AA4E
MLYRATPPPGTRPCLALIVYATLARLAARPALLGHAETYWVVVIERFSAYDLLGFLLSFLLSGRFTLSSALATSVPILLELLQALTPDHEPEFFDVSQTVVGGIIGVTLSQAILIFLPRPPP